MSITLFLSKSAVFVEISFIFSFLFVAFGFFLAVTFGGFFFRFLTGGRLGRFEVLDDDGDAAVGGVVGLVGEAEALIGEAADLGDLVGADAVIHHDAAGGVGAV